MSNNQQPSFQYASILAQPNTQNNEYTKPTIFDVIVQENMQSLFKSSFSHFFKWLINNSNRFRKLKAYSDELYLLLHSSIEFLYLKAYNALFAEYFYGMKRLNIKNNMHRILSIIFSIVVPYLKSKLDSIYEKIELELDEQQLNFEISNTTQKLNRLKLKIKKFMLKFYPYIHLAWSIVFWYYRFKFMINTSDYNSPLLRILNQRLVYDTDRDLNTSQLSLFKKLLNYSNYAFTSLLFMIQFYQWYNEYSSEENRPLTLVNMLKKSGVINDHNAHNDAFIPPPKLTAKLENNKAFKLLQEKNLCPLCTKKRTNECVLSVSGFVFCYVCIFKFVREHQRCPLTNHPCTVKNIIRIFNSTD